ncbi:hypothetical protein F4814DRAFT_458062 [Daldinia grandis]|nr:hypothetical protein F4814DRAFT_458062 [Daldinia grandis]
MINSNSRTQGLAAKSWISGHDKDISECFRETEWHGVSLHGLWHWCSRFRLKAHAPSSRQFYTSSLGVLAMDIYLLMYFISKIMTILIYDIWTTRSFVQLNRHRNPTIQDYSWERLSLSKIRPGLRDDEEAIATEFCRGVWAGYAYIPQRTITALSLKGPKTRDQPFDKQQLALSKYELGTRFSDQFEVVERTRNSVTVRAGGSPLEPGPREFDGILILSAKVNKEDRTVEVGINTAFFNSVEPVRDGKKPSSFAVELLHRYYVRALVDAIKSVTPLEVV